MMFNDLRKGIILISVMALFAIAIPIICLSSDGTSSTDPTDFAITAVLKNSSPLFIIHISCLISMIPLVIDIIIDFCFENEVISAAIHVRERFVIFIGLAIFSITYLSLRSSDFISFYYVAANYAKVIAVVVATYCAIYSELAKLSIRFLFIVTSAFGLWIVSNILTVYSLCFNCQLLTYPATALQIFSYFTVLAFTYHWFSQLSVRHGGKLNFNQLSTDEFSFLAFWIPLMVYAPSITLWNLVTGDLSWASHSEDELLFSMVMHLFFSIALIVGPGRIVRMLAITNMNILNLKQIFVRYISHEIRSPLNIVHAGLDIIRAEINPHSNELFLPSLSKEAAEMIEDVYSASETAIDILNDLLNYENIDAGNFKLELSWQPVMNIFEKSFSWAEAMAAKKQIGLIIEDTTVPTARSPSQIGADLEGGQSPLADHSFENNSFVQIDAYKLESVMRTLITNAIKFTPSGGFVQVRMSCVLQSDSNNNKIISRVGVDAVGYLRFEVNDSGDGIPPENHHLVFGQTGQFNKNELQGGGGSGLGLWISRRIIHMHNGRIGFSSAGRGQGSSFYFELPVYDAGVACADQAPKPHSWSGKADLVNKPRRRGSSRKSNNLKVVPNNSNEEDHRRTFVVPFIPEASSPQEACRLLVDTLPRETSFCVEVNPEPAEQKSDQNCCREESLHTFRFLLVDDSSMNRKIMARIVGDVKEGPLAGSELLEADDGMTAVETMRSELHAGRTVDFILMDFVMVHMNGPEAAEIIRKQMQYSGTIIGVTGNVLPDDIAKYIAKGANEVVTKPLTKLKLLNALTRYLPKE